MGQFEWLLREAIERGYKVGFVAGSDDHKGRPGAQLSRFVFLWRIWRIDLRAGAHVDARGDLGSD